MSRNTKQSQLQVVIERRTPRAVRETVVYRGKPGGATIALYDVNTAGTAAIGWIGIDRDPDTGEWSISIEVDNASGHITQRVVTIDESQRIS